MTEYAPEYIEWDGSEQCLEQIMIRWGKMSLDHPRHCEGRGMEGSTAGPARRYQTGLYVTFTHNDKKVELELGDRIYFREHGGGIYHSPNPGVVVLHSPQDHFQISARGTAFTSSKWKLPEGIWEPWDLYGRPATINGIAVTIRGVEAFASARSPSSPYRHSFAVLVSNEDARKILGEK